jgi:2-amino-4-hydroxy-6-hydroxymethyldihydropteridine diphosphokinase/dihydropteroate synthase
VRSILQSKLAKPDISRLIPNQALDQKSPWKLTQDYLNALPVSSPPMSTVTALGPSKLILRPLKADRRTTVMAIINMSPDSFSNEGIHSGRNREIFTYTSAKIFDIGGQSTAPNAERIDAATELSRILPEITAINSPGYVPRHRDDFAISIDTFHASVAEAAIAAGADIINDVSAGQLDPAMLSTVARLGKTICLMHMRGDPSTMKSLNSYPDGLIPTIAQELLDRVAEAEAAGIRRWRIILDPGIGFAKDVKQNLEILRRLDELRDWPGLRGLPWLVGTSRKSFIGAVTGVVEPHNRIEGTAATVAASVWGGADIVRVHDVASMEKVVKMSDEIWRGEEQHSSINNSGIDD